MHMRVRIVSMGRVWVCMILCCSQIQYIHMVAPKQAQGLGVELRKKSKDLSASERELSVIFHGWSYIQSHVVPLNVTSSSTSIPVLVAFA